MNWVTSLFSGFFGAIAKPIQQWQERKTLKQQNTFQLEQKEQEIKFAVVETRLEMIKKGQTIDFDLDKLSMIEMKNSYKDEVVLFVFLVPMVLSFTNYADEILKGFSVIEKMPNWYMLLIVGMVVVIYGLRGLLTKWLDNKNMFKIGK